MNYTKDSIENRNYKVKLIVQIMKRLLYIILIVMMYNAFLITYSALNEAKSKEIFGYKAYIITTESMKPSVRSGDVVIVEKCPEINLKIGDIITINRNR